MFGIEYCKDILVEQKLVDFKMDIMFQKTWKSTFWNMCDVIIERPPKPGFPNLISFNASLLGKKEFWRNP